MNFLDLTINNVNVARQYLVTSDLYTLSQSNLTMWILQGYDTYIDSTRNYNEDLSQYIYDLHNEDDPDLAYYKRITSYQADFNTYKNVEYLSLDFKDPESFKDVDNIDLSGLTSAKYMQLYLYVGESMECWEKMIVPTSVTYLRIDYALVKNLLGTMDFLNNLNSSYDFGNIFGVWLNFNEQLTATINYLVNLEYLHMNLCFDLPLLDRLDDISLKNSYTINLRNILQANHPHIKMCIT